MSYILLKIYAFIFGSLLGSFANVLIHRIPLGQSVIFPRSHCPQCQKIIRWYDNVPILSFFLLRRKCRHCGNSINWRYPAVEFICGIVSFFLFPKILTFYTFALYLFYLNIFIIFISHFVIDLIHQILPDVLNFYLLCLFGVYAFLYLSWKLTIIGFLVGLLIPSLVNWTYLLLRGRDGLGGGDIKLFACLGVYLGPIGVLQNIFASCFLGSLIGGAYLLFRRMDASRPIPFGPFIIIVAFFQIYFPEESSQVFSFLK